MLRADHRGSALLVTLAFVLLVTVVILAFFSQTRSTLSISGSVPTRVALDALSDSAIETTISDLRLEMLAGAEASRTGFASFDPMIVQQRWAMVPARVISPRVQSASGFDNLVKQSLRGQPFYPGANPSSAYSAQGPAGAVGSRRASEVNTGKESPNGRKLSAKRWDAVGLTESAAPDDALPDWIYATRGGIPADAQSLSGAAVSDASLGNPDYVVGRYAYNIYDVGGLLNANAAGAPQSLATDASRKGSLAWADLRAVGLTTDQIAQFVNFRSRHSKDLSGYAARIRDDAEREGFLEPLETSAGYDGFFHTRKDLLRFFLNVFGRESVEDCTAAEREILASFAHDLRFLAAPSWDPAPYRDSLKPSDGLGFPVKIRPADKGGNDSQGQDDVINPNLSVFDQNTRRPVFVVTADGEFTRLRFDDSGHPTREVPAKKGEPFVNSRFPLSRLSLLTPAATAAKASPIERYFGLTRASASDPWIYEHGGNGTILTLEKVRDLSREPDMAELLKAAILAGSLGKSAGEMTAGSTFANERDQSLDGQVIQILANLIDQSDMDGYPTEISFGEEAFYGVENLPYLTRVKTFLVRMLPDTEPDAANQPFELAFLPEVWNPHDSVNLPTGGTPAEIRVVADTRIPGLDEATLFPVRVKNNTTGTAWTIVLNAGFTPSANHIDLDAAALASKEPVLLKSGFPADAATVPNPVGIHTVPFTVPYASGAIGFQIFSDNTYPGVSFALEYRGSDGNWRRYFERRLVRSADATTGGSALAPRGRSSLGYYAQQNNCRTIAPDPRSDRFSSDRIQELDTDANAYADDAALRPNQRAGHGFLYSADRPLRPDVRFGWTLGAASPTTTANSTAQAIGTILQNTATSATRYTDPDGVLRPGDGALATGSGKEGQMYWPGNLPSRPIVLNRPFRSVGEMGYAFRGTPCRSLDFFSTASGDAALLDFFSVSETPDDGITGGRVSVNAASVNVLAALLRGALADEGDAAGSALKDDRALEAAQSLAARVKDTGDGGPLLNRTELVTRWLGDEKNMPIGSSSERIKRQREVFIRALADAAETRTWNLLIDLIAQTGRIPKGRTALDQFLVESERHVWVHLSIDRLTGRILHLSQEPADD